MTSPEAFYRTSQTAERYAGLPFAAWLGGFVEHLQSREFHRPTVRNYLSRLHHVGRYLQLRSLPVEALTDAAMVDSYLGWWNQEFQDRHGRPPGRSHWLAAGRCIRELVCYARLAGLLPPAEEPAPVLPDMLADYLEFCKMHRGISVSSQRSHERYLGRLATFCAAQGVEDLCNIPLAVLDAFIAHMGHSMKRETLHGLVGIVRSLLRYLFIVGKEAQDRSAWIEYPSVFREMKLPRHLSDVQLAQALAHIDRTMPAGKRDWAVLTLLSCYGLRIGEIAGLRMSDLDFDTSRLHVRRLKGGGEQCLPMTSAVADALHDYLDHVRPSSRHAEVFLTFRPPVRPFRNGSTLATVCVRKHVPADAALPARGAHAFRHTTARRLRQAGAPLGVVRQILGHRTTDTTNRYLRIAVEELQEVADNYAELLG